VISVLRITDRKNVPLPWWSKVAAFTRRKVFRFEPGLNIVWGRNGSGKSTLVRLLARLKHCEQGGIQKVTSNSLGDLFEHARYAEEQILGVELEHDGAPVLYLDLESLPGLYGGLAAFDHDFTDMLGGSMSTRTMSSGQGTYARINMLGHAFSKSGGVVKWLVEKDSVNALWKERVEATEKLLGEPPKDQPHNVTYLFDEPDRSLDWPRKVEVWGFMERLASHSQVIVSSHSSLALCRSGASYIDIGVPGEREEYRKLCESVIKHDALRIMGNSDVGG